MEDQVNNIKAILSNKMYLGIIVFIVVFGLYYMYSNKILFFSNKNSTPPSSSEPTLPDDNKPILLDFNKEYHILDENNNPAKINIKEMMILHKHLMEQQQQMQHELMQYQQMYAREVKVPKKQEKQEKQVKHPVKKQVKYETESESENSDELSDTQLNNSEINRLKQQLEELEKQNKQL